MINSLLILVLAALCEVWGLELRMDRNYGNEYDQLLCDVVTTKMDKVLLTILEISITEDTDPLNKVNLASSSALQPGLHTGNENDGSMKAIGGVSRYQAKLDIRFSKKRNLELGSFLCELTFVRQSGYIDKIYSVVKPDLSDVNKDKLTDNSELILAVQNSLSTMANDTKVELDQLLVTTNLHRDQADLLTNLTEQLSSTVSQISDSVDAFKNRAENNEATLARLISHVEAMDGRLTNMSIMISKLYRPTETECYKGMPGEITSLRIPVQVMGNKTALCDTITDDGGWIIIQRRVSGDVDFYRGWEDYKNGFGNVTTDYWLGNEAVHQLTSLGNFQLRVDMMYQGKKYYAQFASFSVGSESSNYTLNVDGYSGDAGDSLTYHNKKPFSTYDHDNSGYNCPDLCDGAWWYDHCYKSNLNGKWREDSYLGMVWFDIVSKKSVSFSEMKIMLS